MRATTHEVLDGRCNVLVTVPGNGPGSVLLETHLDTVEVEGMSVAPYEPVVDEERLYGRGSCDAKASLAAFMLALERLVSGGPRPNTVVLAAVVDEEHRYRGVTALREHGLAFDGAIVGEPTSLRMVVAHKGCMRCRITASGAGGHSSEPWGKVNAIELAAEVVRYLRDEYVPRLDRSAHAFVGRPSCAVTTVDGGSGPNVLPASCSLSIDRRTVPGEDPHQTWESLRADIEARWPDQVTVAPPDVVDYALATDPNDPFVRAVATSLRTGGCDAEPQGVGHGTDASKIALDGVPAVVFGPGAIADAHTHAESVPLSQVDTAVDVVEHLLRTPIQSGASGRQT
ncbi:MAG: M20/M25/M40 family metallo-hydrolase [Streptosporangiales bacterium]